MKSFVRITTKEGDMHIFNDVEEVSFKFYPKDIDSYADAVSFDWNAKKLRENYTSEKMKLQTP